MIAREIKAWVMSRLAMVVRKQLVRGRAAQGYYSNDGYPSAPDEPESADVSQRFGIYGVAREIPDNCEVIVLAIHGASTNRVAVAERHPAEPEIEQGEVLLWTTFGQRLLLNKDGDVVVLPAAGRSILLGDSSAAAVDKVVTASELRAILNTIKGHKHAETGTETAISGELATISLAGSPNVLAKKP